MTPSAAPHQQRIGELILLVTTMLWGTTFVMTQDVLVTWPPFYLLTARFALASLVFVPCLLATRLSGGAAISWAHVRRGAMLGTALFGGFTLQTLSLGHTTSARVAFGTSLVTVLVPLLGFLILRWRWSAGTYVALGAAACGISTLFGPAISAGGGVGDLLALSCAGGFATHLLLLSHFARTTPVLVLVTTELATTALWSVVTAQLTHEALPMPPWSAWPGVVFLGIITTAGCLFAQVYGQSRTTANRAAFIYALEPLFAALFAWAWHGQALTHHEWVGGLLITTAALTADRRAPAWLRLPRFF